jgi:cytochrome c551/c552
MKISLNHLLIGGVLVCALSPLALAQSGARMIAEGSGPDHRMGPGMMGGGMMARPSGGIQTPGGAAYSDQAKSLVSYIHDQSLTCFQCHSMSVSGLVPSFDAVSVQYASRADAKVILENHIVHGVGEMPENLATEPQARQLAGLILNLK